MADQTADWTGFLGRAPERIDGEIVRKFLDGKRVLITGAGGYIGSALVRYFLGISIQSLVLIDIAEGGLFELQAEIEEKQNLIPCSTLVGDICDLPFLRDTFEVCKPQVIFHAAAYKHVTLMEANPFAAVRNNTLGTHRVLEAANEIGAEQVIVVSTDKAADPIGIMGISKRIAEMLVNASTGSTRIKTVRLANVLGSTGSVAPIFVHQVALGRPIKITDPLCTRYFLSVEEVIHRLISALNIDDDSAILAAEAGEPFSIVHLANYLIENTPSVRGGMKIEYTQLRAGEKLTECMVGIHEYSNPSNVSSLRTVITRLPTDTVTLAKAMKSLEVAIYERDLYSLFTVIKDLLPSNPFSLGVIRDQPGSVKEAV